MTDEEMRAIRGILKNLRNGTADFVSLVEASNLIESLLNEIERLKKRLNACDRKNEVNTILARDVYYQTQASLERLKEIQPRPEDE